MALVQGVEMDVFVNGDRRTVAEGATLNTLLTECRVNPQSVVVEHNEIVVPRDALAQTRLASGDKVEIVRFVGGGRF